MAQTAKDRRTAPRVTERRNRDEAVMEAAISVMSERGYAGTSIQEVADRVGVLKGSLYHYFSSKEELLARILEESHAESREIATRIAALGLEPADELFAFLRESTLWYLTHTERAHIYFSEGRHLTGERLEKMRANGREFRDHIGDLIVRAQQTGGILVTLDARLVRRFVIGALNNVRAWRTRPDDDFSDGVLADAFVDLMRNALLAPAK